MKYYYIIEGKHRGNIGDILQGMVAKRFLPDDCEPVDRESLSAMQTDIPGLLIGNAWYMHDWTNFPPPPNITPIYISVHIAESKMLKEKHIREHFSLHSPIGCRDHKTLKLFLGWGIPAYYSGCLTTTTFARDQINTSEDGECFLVDNFDHLIPDDVKDKLEKLFGTQLSRISHNPPDTFGSLEEYDQKAIQHMEALLKRYCRAKLVITTKIHCALPCLAMGVNVILIHPNLNDPRLQSVSKFLRVYSFDEILKTDSVPVSHVDQRKLQKSQKFITELITDGIKSHSNIVKTSSRTRYRLMRFKAKLKATVFSAIIKCWLKIGSHPKRLKEVYGD